MDRTRAARIVAAYQCVAELIADLKYGAPVSLLPYSKVEIKKALKVLLLETGDSVAQAQHMSNYLLLSRFVADDQARKGIVIQAALTADDPDWLAEQNPPATMVSAIHHERLELYKELRSFMEGD